MDPSSIVDMNRWGDWILPCVCTYVRYEYVNVGCLLGLLGIGEEWIVYWVFVHMLDMKYLMFLIVNMLPRDARYWRHIVSGSTKCFPRVVEH